MRFVVTTRIGVVVYPRVAGQLIRTGKTLAAARELTGVWLFACVCADVASLVLEAVEGLITERALVRTRHFRCAFRALFVHKQRAVGANEGTGCGLGTAHLGIFRLVLKLLMDHAATTTACSRR